MCGFVISHDSSVRAQGRAVNRNAVGSVATTITDMARPRTAETAQRVLDAAVRVLGTQGGGALSVRAVAAEAGCSTMAVYTYFDGKSGLLDAIITAGFEGLDAAVESACDALPSGRGQLEAGAVAYRRWALDHGTQYEVMLTPFVPGFDASQATLSRGQQSFAAHVARVRAAIAAGDLVASSGHEPAGEVTEPDAATRLARFTWATVHGHVMVDLLERPADDLAAERAFLEAVRWSLDGVAPRQ